MDAVLIHSVNTKCWIPRNQLLSEIEGMIFLHDTTRTLVSNTSTQKLDSFGREILEYSRYSSGLLSGIEIASGPIHLKDILLRRITLYN